MKKYIKKHLKDEKRILKLMYKKGIFETLGIDLKDLGWEYLLTGKRLRKRKDKREFSFHEYLPELHIFTKNYWDEGDSYSVVKCLKDYIYFTETDNDEDGFPLNTKYPENRDIINYLLKLPTKRNDNNFNKFLIRSSDN